MSWWDRVQEWLLDSLLDFIDIVWRNRYLIGFIVLMLVLGSVTIRAYQTRDRTWAGKQRRRKVLMYVLLLLVAVSIIALGWWAVKFSFEIVRGFPSLSLNDALPEAISLSAIGLLTMAILQSIRLLFPIRAWFHSRMMKKWLSPRPPARKKKRSKSSKTEQPTSSKIEGLKRTMWREQRPIAELMLLMGSTNRVSLFDLPIDQLCGQIGAAVETAIVNPRRYRRLLRAMLGGESEVLRKLTAKRAASPISSEQDDLDQDRNTVSYQIQRRIDGFQIATAADWKRWLRMVAIYISGVIGIIATVAHGTFSPSDPSNWPKLVIAFVISGLAAGFLASMFRDLAAIVEKLRQ